MADVGLHHERSAQVDGALVHRDEAESSGGDRAVRRIEPASVVVDLERDRPVRPLEVVGRTHGITTRLDAGSLGEVAPDTEQALFRIAQEALTNVVKHASADSVAVHLERTDGAISLEVDDDGRGFDPSDRSISARRLGLVSMHERAVDLGGSLVVESELGHGTSVRAKVPAG